MKTNPAILLAVASASFLLSFPFLIQNRRQPAEGAGRSTVPSLTPDAVAQTEIDNFRVKARSNASDFLRTVDEQQLEQKLETAVEFARAYVRYLDGVPFAELQTRSWKEFLALATQAKDTIRSLRAVAKRQADGDTDPETMLQCKILAQKFQVDVAAFNRKLDDLGANNPARPSTSNSAHTSEYAHEYARHADLGYKRYPSKDEIREILILDARLAVKEGTMSVTAFERWTGEKY